VAFPLELFFCWQPTIFSISLGNLCNQSHDMGPSSLPHYLLYIMTSVIFFGMYIVWLKWVKTLSCCIDTLHVGLALLVHNFIYCKLFK
jgi:hypothetical protein